jgi:plasma-membrane choline transporter
VLPYYQPTTSHPPHSSPDTSAPTPPSPPSTETGYSFCTAAKRAFQLLFRNILRVAAVSLISEALLFLGKLFITVPLFFFAYTAFMS